MTFDTLKPMNNTEVTNQLLHSLHVFYIYTNKVAYCFDRNNFMLLV